MNLEIKNIRDAWEIKRGLVLRIQQKQEIIGRLEKEQKGKESHKIANYKADQNTSFGLLKKVKDILNNFYEAKEEEEINNRNWEAVAESIYKRNGDIRATCKEILQARDLEKENNESKK